MQKCVLWDFGDTLADERWMLEPLDGAPEWPEVWARRRGSQKLAGEAERYRSRQGAYRVVYSVEDEQRIVQVVKIGHRREVYR